MGKTSTYTAEQFIDAIPGTGGIVTSIAKKVGCKWHTAKKFIDEYPTVKQAWKNERESILDMAEAALFKQVQGGEAWAVKYTLSTIGKDRGYTERQEHTGDSGGAIEHKVVVIFDGNAGNTPSADDNAATGD